MYVLWFAATSRGRHANAEPVGSKLIVGYLCVELFSAPAAIRVTRVRQILLLKFHWKWEDDERKGLRQKEKRCRFNPRFVYVIYSFTSGQSSDRIHKRITKIGE